MQDREKNKRLHETITELMATKDSLEQRAYSLLNELGLKEHTQRQLAVVISFLDAVRLDEAKWWASNWRHIDQAWLTQDGARRIAELEGRA